VPITPFGTPSTNEVPEAIAPYLPEHDVLLLENHGALAVGSDVITAYYRMETLELVANTTFHARLLLGVGDVEEREIPRETLERLFSMREGYKVTGKHPGYKKYH
jgi:L-fuculose-phosphate aldolase